MPTSLQWNPGLIARFWNGLGESGIHERLGFATLAGPVLTEFVLPWIGGGARCLDFGSGTGALARLLLEANVQLAAYEPSASQARVVEERLGKFPNFLGTVGSADRATFDFVICTEVIEHVPDDQIESFGAALVRQMDRGGRLLLSTPHAENLIDNAVYCPVCDHTFHRWQHQRSWRIEEIATLMERWGLSKEWIGLVGFDDPNPVREFNLHQRVGEAWPWIAEPRVGTRFPLIGRGDHIVYVGVRPQRGVLVMREPDRLSFDGSSPGTGIGGDGREDCGQSPARTLVGPPAETLPNSRPLMAEDWDLLSAGVDMAKGLGLTPIAVVVGSRDRPVDAPTIVEADDLLTASGARGSASSGSAAVVFPGPNVALEQAIAEGRLPDTSVALFLEGGQWRRARPAMIRSGASAHEPDRHRPARIFVNRWKAEILTYSRSNRPLRRLQPMFDRREAGVLATLLDPGNYPYRLKRVVEGRVMLATGTLGSGGAERQLINTAQGLRERGAGDVHILVEHLDPASGRDFYLEKAKAAALSVVSSADHFYSAHPWALQHPRFRRTLSDSLISRIFNVSEVIKTLSPEVVQISLDWSNITVGLAAVLAGVPHVFVSGRNLSPTHFEFFQWFMYPCYRALARCPGVHFLNNSEAGRLDYARWLRLDPKNIRVLRNGLQTVEFPPLSASMRRAARKELGLSAATPAVVGAFRLSGEKQPLLWIDAAARIRQQIPDCHFLLCGVGPMQSEIEARAARHGLSSRLRLLGSRSDIATIFSAADLVLQSSLQEGTPNVLLEAQAMGVPVVTTPAFGAAEAVHDGVTGFVVRKNKAAALAQAAVSILNDAGVAARMRHEGPRFIEARFGFKRMIDDTLVAYADAGVGWAAQFLPEDHKAS